jgi:hypothetical protein
MLERSLSKESKNNTTDLCDVGESQQSVKQMAMDLNKSTSLFSATIIIFCTAAKVIKLVLSNE